ncbi:MAG: HAMP domain-containing protein [Phycisphaerales bacterium]|nr:HAMP domain-containing protein [Phycisphaerales bacterium]
MQSLFLKIFMWFWLAVTIVIAGLAAVTWLYPYSAMPPRPVPARLHELQARGAFAVFELRGQDAFELHCRSLESASHLKTYFVDDKGRELRGEPVPERLRSLLEDHRSELDAGQSVIVDSGARMAVPMEAGDGRTAGVVALVEAEPSDRRPSTGSGRTPPGQGPRFELLVPVPMLLLRLLAVVLTAGLGCYALARYLTSPLRRLQRVVRRLALGDLAARVDPVLVSRRDEIGELAREFDRMVQQVAASISAQRMLMRDVSHELRSPLARLNVAIELAARDAGVDGAKALDRATRDVERLNEMLGRILMLARFEGGAESISASPVVLHEVVQDVVSDSEFEVGSAERHVRLVRCDPCTVLGERHLIRSAIENVVRNAARYTARGTSVEVSLLAPEGEERAVVEIRDHGPGVPEASLAHIFRAFHRLRDDPSEASGGIGLGLAIADRAVRAHGGAVGASNAPGGGLVVRMELPIAQPTVDPAARPL